MATETTTGLSGHVRGVTVTTIACLAGIAAAVASGYVVGTTPEAATNTLALAILLGFVVVEYPLLHVVGVDIGEFGVKDNLYIAFMTFTLWFITYAVLLTSEVTF